MIAKDSDLSKEYYVSYYDELRVTKLECYCGLIGFKTIDGKFYHQDELFYTKEEAVEDILNWIDDQIEELEKAKNRILNDK